MRHAMICSVALLLALASPAAAQTGGFVVRLGADTVSVERYTMSAGRLVVDQLGRSPRVMQRHIEYDYDASGALTKFTVRVNPAGAAPGAPPSQTILGTCTADSVITEIGTPGGKTTLRTALAAGSSLLFMTSPWTQYERLTQKLMAQKADTVRNDMWIVSFPTTGWLRATKLGRDSVRMENDHADVFHMRVDRSGRLLHVRPVSGTGKFTVDRGTPDMAAMAAQWLAAEKAAGAMGSLSVRDTVRAVVAGDSLWVDYGRPAKRGRNVFGEVVPFGEVWRTGANGATQLSTSKALDFGGVLVAPGRYSVWTIPTAKGWTLILNSQSGQWGTDHDATKDVYKIALAVEALPDVVERFTINLVPRGAGGVLQLDWDTTRASAEFVVK